MLTPVSHQRGDLALPVADDIEDLVAQPYLVLTSEILEEP
jgi:hypothetical protein